MKRFYLLCPLLLAFSVGIFAQSSSIRISQRIQMTGMEDGVAISSDDAEQINEEIDKLFDDDLDMGWEGDEFNVATVGLRFRDLAIPPGATIDSAFMIFYSHEDEGDRANITIKGEATGDALTFNETDLITARPSTTAQIRWEITEDWTIWTPYQTPDLSAIIQEIVNRADWASGNAMAFVFQGEDQGASDADNARDFESLENIADPDDGGDGLHHPERIPELIVFYSESGATTSEPLTLRIIHNNDGESKLLPTEIDGQLIGGAAPFKTVVDGLRAEGTPSIMLSSGDNFLAGVVFDSNEEGQPLYDAQVLDALNYDAICIGNHDFDFGPDVLAQMITDFSTTQPPYLSANLDFSGEANLQALVEAGRILPKTTVTVGGQPIGIIGLTTGNLPSITTTGNVVVNQDIVSIAQAEINALKAEGVNKIILISHLQGIDEEIALASRLTDVDVIIAGGGDELLTNDASIALPGVNVFGGYPFEVTDAAGATTRIVTTPGEYRYVGNLIVAFDADGNITAVDTTSNPILVADVTPDADLQANVVVPLEAAIANVQVLARTKVDLDGTRGSIRSVETNEGNLIADALLFAVENAEAGLDANIPVVALTNGGGIRNNNIIRANSELTDNTTKAMLPFGNGVVVLNPATPTQVKTVLENAVAAIGSGEGTGRFGQIGGFSFIYNPAETPSTFNEDGTVLVQEGSRIISATLDDGTVIIQNGQVVADAPSVYFVTNDFIAGGRDGYTTFGELGILATISEDYQLPLNDYLVKGLNGVITAEQYPAGGEGRILVSSDLTVRFIHNNDGESKLLPVEIDGRMIGGAAPFKTVVDNLRAEGTPNIMLSSGDNFLAGVVFEANEEGQPLYDAQVLDALDYDAICIGNHDFDFGPEVLAQMISDFSTSMPPYLSANLIFDEEPSLAALEEMGRIAPFEVLIVNGQVIGVFALTTPNLASISNTGNVEVETDILGTAEVVIELFKEAGINKIVMISHLQGIEEEIDLAGKLTDLDIIIAGGGDELLTNDPSITLPGINVFGTYPLAVADAAGDTTYIVTTPGEYRYVGNLVVNFDAAGKVTSIAEESNPILVEGVAPDAEIQANVIDPIIEAIANVQTLAITEVDLDGTRSGVRSRETNEGNLVADAFLFVAEKNKPADLDAALPIVALTNGGGMRDDAIIRAGSAITDRKTKEILLFGNKVVMLNQMTPAQLKTVCENAVAAIGSGAGTGRFGQIGGFEFVYNPNETPSTFSEDGLMLVEEGNRIVAITLADGTKIVDKGEVVADAPNVYMVTNDFIAGGRDGYTTFGELGILAEVSEDYQFALNEYLVEGLNGVVTTEQYPAGGEGRITIGQIIIPGESIRFSQRIQMTEMEDGVAVSSDDVEQINQEIDKLFDDDLDAGWEGDEFNIATVGIRFRDVAIPAGATIDSAFMVFYAHEDEGDPAFLTINGEGNVNPVTYNDTDLVTDRPTTEASVRWEVTEEWSIWQPYQTADIAPIVQELVNKDGWVSGNAMAFSIVGEDQGASDADNARDMESYENIADPEDGGDGLNHPEGIPELLIYYRVTTSTNEIDVTQEVNVFPNPNKTGVFAIQTDAFLGEDVLIKVNNMNGQLVKELTIDKMTNPQQIIDIPAKSGMYFIEMISADKRAVAKVVIQ